MGFITDLAKVERTIDSCVTEEQVVVSKKLVDRFRRFYKDELKDQESYDIFSDVYF